jgi:hypothetical protein
MTLASGLWGTRGPAAGGSANIAMIAQMNGGYVEMREECHNCHQVGHLARNCPKGSTPAAGAATAKMGGHFKKKKVGVTRRGRNRELIRVLMALFKRPRLMPLGNLNLVMGSNMGRETDGAGNHISECPAQNASNTSKKKPRPTPTLPLTNSRCPLFLSTCIFCR